MRTLPNLSLVSELNTCQNSDNYGYLAHKQTFSKPLHIFRRKFREQDMDELVSVFKGLLHDFFAIIDFSFRNVCRNICLFLIS